MRQPFDELAGAADRQPDLAAAARTCYAAWASELGAAMAEERVRRHYPDQADAIIAEARHLLGDAS